MEENKKVTKAYDLKELGQLIIEEIGLKDAEIAVEQIGKAAYIAVKKWAKESAVLSENKIDDICAPFYDHVDGFILPQIQKIDLDGNGN